MRDPTPFTSKMTTEELITHLREGPPLAFMALQQWPVRDVVAEAGEVIRFERNEAEENARRRHFDDRGR